MATIEFAVPFETHQGLEMHAQAASLPVEEFVVMWLSESMDEPNCEGFQERLVNLPPWPTCQIVSPPADWTD